MKWIGISGSWREKSDEIETKVKNTVREIMERGDGVISGGALGVDFVVVDEALKYDPHAERIKVFLPTTLQMSATHYRKHASWGTITDNEAERLIRQLEYLKRVNPKALIEKLDVEFNEETQKEHYYGRNQDIVNSSDEFIAFRARTKESEESGTADAVEKAKKKGFLSRFFNSISQNNLPVAFFYLCFPK